MNNNAKVTRRVVNSLPVLALALASALCLDIRPSEALSLVPIAQDFQPPSGRQSVQTFRLENKSDQPEKWRSS